MLMLHFVCIISVFISSQDDAQLLKTLKLDGAFVVDMEEHYRPSAGNVI